MLQLLLALLVDEATCILARVGSTARRPDSPHVGPAFLANMPFAGVVLHLPAIAIAHTALSATPAVSAMEEREAGNLVGTERLRFFAVMAPP